VRPKRISVISSANEPADILLAPSWSWVSYPASSTTPLPHSWLQTLVELVSCHVVPKSGDVFGQLVGGELVIKGALFEIFDTYERRCSYISCLDYRVRNYDIPLYFLPFAEEEGNPSLFVGLFVGLFVQESEVKSTYRRVGCLSGFRPSKISPRNFLDADQWERLQNLHNSGEERELITLV